MRFGKRVLLHHSTSGGGRGRKAVESPEEYRQKMEAARRAILKARESKDVQKSINKMTDTMLLNLYNRVGFEKESPTSYHLVQKPEGISENQTALLQNLWNRRIEKIQKTRNVSPEEFVRLNDIWLRLDMQWKLPRKGEKP